MARWILVGLGLLLITAGVWATLGGGSSETTTTRRLSPSEPAVIVNLNDTRLSFPGATGWSEDAGCTDVAETDPCVGQWRHDAGQRVQILLIPVPDATRLAAFQERFVAQVRAQGGVAEVIDHNGAQVVRALQPMRGDDDALFVGITYALTAPGGTGLHLVTSRAPLADEEAADGRVRDLLAFGAWIDAAVDGGA